MSVADERTDTALAPARVLDRRLAPRPLGRLDIQSTLRHFALVNYALPAERLAPHLPADRFDIPTFDVGGRRLAFVSAVPFVDDDFRFARLLPFVKARFCQTNFRAYVVHRASGQHAVWFFGTTLGSWLCHPARWLWRIPWHRARYRTDFAHDPAAGRYTRFRYQIRSRWCDAEIELDDTGEPVGDVPGFPDRDEMTLVLTHPVDGYFYRLDGTVGTYSVSHERLQLTRARPRALHFSLFERLGLLSRDEMGKPHSVMITQSTRFDIHMPPRRLRP